ncbi:MAG: hypothetical protein KAS64_02985, partial [Spirochaetes bacterium]|nr:hypothetical protein [Spirochaetota bacterium]
MNTRRTVLKTTFYIFLLIFLYITCLSLNIFADPVVKGGTSDNLEKKDFDEKKKDIDDKDSDKKKKDTDDDKDSDDKKDDHLKDDDIFKDDGKTKKDYILTIVNEYRKRLET